MYVKDIRWNVNNISSLSQNCFLNPDKWEGLWGGEDDMSLAVGDSKTLECSYQQFIRGHARQSLYCIALYIDGCNIYFQNYGENKSVTP